MPALTTQMSAGFEHNSCSHNITGYQMEHLDVIRGLEAKMSALGGQ